MSLSVALLLALVLAVVVLGERVRRLGEAVKELRMPAEAPAGQPSLSGGLEATAGALRAASLEGGLSGERPGEVPMPVRIISPERAKRSLEARYAARARDLEQIRRRAEA